MRRASLLLLCYAVHAAAQDYAIRGTLTSSVDRAPVKHGHLTANLVDGDARSIDADDKGHFVLPLPGPGAWKLTASAPGFRPAALDEHERFSTAVVLRPSSRTADVLFRLNPDASLAGYVLDEAGEAVRGAQVTLLAQRGAQADDEERVWQRRATTRADDRGHYEFPGLAPGGYQVVVQAQPWYADGAQRRFGGGIAAQPDSPLDVAYPLTWYPGVTDAAAAGVVTLEGGAAGQADVPLLPVPSLHLHIAAAAQSPSGQFERISPVPQVQLLWPDGSTSFQPIRPVFDPRGEMDLGGLAPGTYRIAPTNGGTQPFELRLGSGSARTLDLNAAIPLTSLTVHFDLADGVAPSAVRLIDTATGRPVLLNGRNGVNGRSGGPPRGGTLDTLDQSGQRPEGFRGGELRDRHEDGGDRQLELPPGRYEVRLAPDRGQSLTGLAAEGATVSERFVTVGAADCRLTLHIAVGRAVVTGSVLNDTALPIAGALVLLVPATWGDPRHFVGIERAQTNTDGSFDLKDVLPGQYILLAIDHGWGIHWSDPATLRHYLLRGVPLDLKDLKGAGSTHETIRAQQP